MFLLAQCPSTNVIASRSRLASRTSVRTGALRRNYTKKRDRSPMTANDIASKPELLLLSAITQAALEQQTVSLRKRLLSGDTTLQDIAGALRISCKDAPHRRVLVCTDRDDALAALAEERSNRVLTGHVEDGLRPTVLLLPGVGDQYVGMGHGLYTTRAVFREEVDRCAYLLEDSLGCDIRKIL